MLAKRAATPERAVEIDVDDVQPVLIGYFFSGGLAPRDASIVDENVDLSMPCRQLIRDLGDARGIRYIHNDDLRVQAFRLQARAAGLGGDGVAIRDHDLRSRLCQRFRARKSDSLTGARHHGRFSVQLEFFQIHLLFLLAGRPSAKFASPVSITFRSRPNDLSVLVEAVQAGRIRRQPDAVAGFQAELSDGAHRERPEFAGVDIEEGVAAQMLGDRHGPGPALSLFADFQMYGPDAQGGNARLASRLSGNEVHLGRSDETGNEQVCRPLV